LTVNSNYARAYQNAAWLMATSPDPKVRNVELALSAAKKAMELGGERSARTLDTLAAATAAVGRHEEAADLQRQALKLADKEEQSEMTQRLRLYVQGKPYLQPQPLGRFDNNPSGKTTTKTASGETTTVVR
jgi:tetratricopeptide (TPR) repeat protein